LLALQTLESPSLEKPTEKRPGVNAFKASTRPILSDKTP